MKLQKLLPIIAKFSTAYTPYDKASAETTLSDDADTIMGYFASQGWATWCEKQRGTVFFRFNRGDKHWIDATLILRNEDGGHAISSSLVVEECPEVPESPYVENEVTPTDVLVSAYKAAIDLPIVERGDDDLPVGTPATGFCVERVELNVGLVSAGRFAILDVLPTLVRIETRAKEGLNGHIMTEHFTLGVHAGSPMLPLRLRAPYALSCALSIISSDTLQRMNPAYPFAHRMNSFKFGFVEGVEDLYIEEDETLPRMYALLTNEIVEIGGKKCFLYTYANPVPHHNSGTASGSECPPLQ